MSTAASGEQQPYPSVRTGDDLPGADEPGLDGPAADAVSQVEVPEPEAGLMEKGHHAAGRTSRWACARRARRRRGDGRADPVGAAPRQGVPGAQLRRRPAGHREGPGGQRHRLRPAAGRDARSGGGVGVRQVDHRPHAAALTEPTGGIVMFEGEDWPSSSRGSFARPVATSRSCSRIRSCCSTRGPGQRHRVRAAGHPRPPQGQTQGAVRELLKTVGSEPRARQPLPARVLGASASASASPGPWPSSRRCSCSTSRCPPSTCPSRPAW